MKWPMEEGGQLFTSLVCAKVDYGLVDRAVYQYTKHQGPWVKAGEENHEPSRLARRVVG